MRTVISSLLDNLGTAASVVAVGGAVLGLYRVATQVYGRTIGSRRDLTRRLNQLAAGVTVRYVEERFGTPAFTGAFAAAPLPPGQSPSGSRPVRELVYRERHAWVQVLVDENDAVARFSITVTDPRLGFRTRDLTFRGLDVRLGQSRFSDLRTWVSPDGRSLRIGAHNHEYAESYWFGNPGNYQRYVISANEIGSGGFGFSIERHGPSFVRSGVLEIGDPHPRDGRDFDPDAAYALQFRAETTINTLTILGPLRQPADLVEPRGPASNHVRVLLPGRREQRQIRRRAKKLMRPNRQGLHNEEPSAPSQECGAATTASAATSGPE